MIKNITVPLLVSPKNDEVPNLTYTTSNGTFFMPIHGNTSPYLITLAFNKISRVTLSPFKACFPVCGTVASKNDLTGCNEKRGLDNPLHFLFLNTSGVLKQFDRMGLPKAHTTSKVRQFLFLPFLASFMGNVLKLTTLSYESHCMGQSLPDNWITALLRSKMKRMLSFIPVI